MALRLPDFTTVKFSELKTNAGDKLPIFKKPPVVLSANADNTEFKIGYTSKDFFRVTIMDYDESLGETAKKIVYATFIIYSTD